MALKNLSEDSQNRIKKMLNPLPNDWILDPVLTLKFKFGSHCGMITVSRGKDAKGNTAYHAYVVQSSTNPDKSFGHTRFMGNVTIDEAMKFALDYLESLDRK